jgi:peptidoglycan-N-acetylglucosamine deacetylase
MRPLILALGAAGTGWSLPALSPHAPRLSDALGIERRVGVQDGVALTFDDGPHPQGTPAVLEALAREGAVATFFLVGEQVERAPALAREIAAAGHAIALHGHRHRNLLRLTPGQLRDDFARVAAVVADATGSAPAVYRPPYGIFSAAGLAMVRQRGWRPVLWSRWGRDWRRRATAESIAADAVGTLGAGDVVLLHDADTYSAPESWRRTAAAVPAVLEALDRAGLRTVTI